MIKLNEVVYDKRARDGTWCTLPYPNHPKGCPKFPACPKSAINFINLSGIGFRSFECFAVVEEFDLKAHAEKMKQKHPKWSDRQCRNLLYWQKSVMKKLREKSFDEMCVATDRVLPIPEACGIDVFKTMERVGIKLERNPDFVRKIMIVVRHNPQNESPTRIIGDDECLKKVLRFAPILVVGKRGHGMDGSFYGSKMT